MVGCSGSHVVDVVVGDKRIVEVDDNSSRIDSIICESSLVNDCDDFGGSLPSFYPEPERVLLSASWKRIMHSVGQEFEGGVPAFRIALAKYAVECGFAVSYLKNDATRGRYKGHLLATTSKDGNQGLFPLAFVIVDAENQDNWMWFLSQLLKVVGSGRRLTFVSDLKCAYAPTVASFQHYMEKLRRTAGNGRVDSMLDGLQNDKWANAFFRGKRYGEMSSNAAESYNNWIGGARELPITCMVDMIRIQIMTQLSNRRAESKRWTTKLCPIMEKKLVDFLKLAKSWDVIVASDTVVEVYSSISSYVDINCFRESYKESIYPVPSSERFDFDGAGSSIIKPPITKKQPGRNKKKRIPSRGENVKQIKCGRCLKYGNHNKKTYKAAI
ncbi:uncharacterized protein LOC114309464 [Camellia sinensis]|uniref:uncharacterized protein LOC114309464 n=1 Tax=Camellia sinensis TaxID=4442 RepID=UPI001036D3EC|nr:uncharacterized protein LOC114309464 [Camellia sinensis]